MILKQTYWPVSVCIYPFSIDAWYVYIQHICLNGGGEGGRVHLGRDVCFFKDPIQGIKF